MTQANEPTENTHNDYRFAGFWIRVAAGVIDAVTLLLFQAVIHAFLGPWILSSDFGPPHQVHAVHKGSTFLVSMVIPLIYDCCFLSSSWMGTPGMKAVSVKILDYAGNRISFGRAFGRHLAQFLSGLILGIGFLMIAFTAHKQGLHDKIARTYVVYR